MRRCLALLISGVLSCGPALAQDADWEACKSYIAETSAAACSRIIASAKEQPAVLAVAHNNRAIAYLALRRQHEALADYGDAIRLDPGAPKAYFNRALALAALGRQEAARADLDAAIYLDPRYAKAYARRGIDRLDAEPGAGVEDILRARELAPELALADDQKRQRNYDEKPPPALATRLATAGSKLAESPGDSASALKAFELALRLEPGNVAAQTGAASLRQPAVQPARPSGPATATPKSPPAKTPAPTTVAAATQPSTPAAATPAGPPRVPTPAPKAAATGTSGVTTDAMQVFTGRAAEGNDLSRAPATTVEDCQARCTATAGCGAYSFDGWNKLCLLKSTATCLRRDPRYTTAVTSGVAVRQSTEATVIDRRRDKAYPGAGYRTQPADTADACADLCQQDDRCEGFNYKVQPKSCSVMARPAEYATEAGTEIGIRSQRASPACRG